ncbi:MAG: peptidylprolyl isomerase [Paracoccaceae bacterium]|jgi:peptidylprolyl isomerase
MLHKICLLCGFVAFSPSGLFAQSIDGPGPNLVISVAGTVSGQIVIDLLPDVAPKHVAQITALAAQGAYNNVVFHRVIDGFMAQTGDVAYGKMGSDISVAGRGGSKLPNIPSEFSEESFERGVLGMARRSQDLNSANSQFFIMLDAAQHLNFQYTVFGRVISGMDVVDAIKKGVGRNGEVTDPDYMKTVTVYE